MLSSHETKEDVERGACLSTVKFSQRPAALAKSLANNTMLTAIDLSCCGFGDAAAAVICAALPKQLQLLRLQDNGLTDLAAPKIAEGLSVCTQLQLLDLSENEFGDQGMKGLASVLPQCTALELLDLGGSDAIT